MTARDVAGLIYRRYVTGRGWQAPANYREMLLLVIASGARVDVYPGSPPEFAGVQMGDTITIAEWPGLSDGQRRRRLAHEWCHWLRRKEAFRRVAGGRGIRFYGGDTDPRDEEEQIAKAFERLF